MAPLTAKFEADFASFYDACKQAVVELDSMEKGAAKAETRLQSMADRFSGEKVIQEAQLMTEAIERLGGVSTLTEKELERVGRVTNEAVEKMKALGLDVPKGMEALANATKDAGKETESLSTSVTDLAASYITAEAAIKLAETAYDALVDATKAVIKSASEAEEADAALLAALRAQGTAVPSVVNAYNDYAAALQKTTTYSDEAIKSAEAVLVQIGGVMPRDMERALQATTNLAAGLRIDLASAATMVAKAAEGQTTALTKAGIVIQSTKDGAADFGSVLDQLNGRFAGAAEAAGNTFAGGLAKLKNAWDDVLEATGRVITENATWAAAVSGITDLVRENTTELNKSATANTLVSDAVILAVKAGGLLVDVLDALQKEIQEDRIFFDQIGIAIQKTAIYFSEAAKAAAQLTAITSTGIVREQAVENVNKINAYLGQLHTMLEANQRAIEDARATEEHWSGALGHVHDQLNTLVEGLKTTEGQTRKLTASAEENDSVWTAITENMKAREEANQKAAEAEKQHAEALAVLASVSEDFHKTVAALNPELVEQVKNYLASGVAADTLAKALRLTAAQVGAISKALQEETQLHKLAEAEAAQHARLELDLAHITREMSHDTYTAQIDELYAWAEAQKKAMEKAKTLTEETGADIEKIVKKTLEAIDQKHLESIPGTEAYYKKAAEEADAYYKFVLAHAEQFTAEAINAAQDAALAAQKDLDDWYAAALKAGKASADAVKGTADGMKQASGVIQATTAALHGTSDALGAIYAGSVQAGTGFDDMLYAAQHLTAAFVDMAGGPGGGWIRSEGFGSAAALNRNAGYRATGGPVSAGLSYVVGERGPEFFTPGASGTITPMTGGVAGGGSTVVVQAGAITLNYPIVNTPQALDALARTVGEAILSKITRTGARL